MSLGSQSNFLFGAASAAASGGFQIERSLRFNSGDSARLTRTPSSAGNRTTWTYSFWVKRSINALFYQSFLINRVSASYDLRIDDPTTPKFYLAFATGVNLTTTPIYRDPGAWMHVVIVHNSATTTSTDRLQLYVNGSRVTSFDSINYPTFNQFSEFNTTDEHGIGYFNANTGLDGYLTNVEFIDGRAVAPTDFGEFDANGLWQPKEYTGTFASTVTQTPSLDGAMIIKADGAQITGYVSGSGLKCLYTSSDGIDWTFQNREAVGPFQSDAKYLAIGAAGTNDITFFPGNGESFTYAMYSATTDFTTQSDITVDTTSLSYSSSGTTSYGANGFHLDFSDNSSASALGTDSSGNGNDWTVTNFSVLSGSISEATGALPLYNTTDTYGRVKGSGFRTDSNASALQIAVAGDSSDEVAYAIRGSGSALALTNTSVTFNQTGKFYSDAYLIQNAGSACEVAEFTDAKPGTSNFCVEFWINPTTTPANSGLFSYGDYNTVGSFGIMTTGSNSLRVDMHDGVTSGARLTVAGGLQANEWQHFALTRTGTNCVLYRNGVSQGSWTIDASADFTPASNPRYVIGNRLGLPFSSYNITSYFQDFRVYVGTAKYSGDFIVVNADIASDNDCLLDSPTNGTQGDTGLGGEVSGNYVTYNPLKETTGGYSMAYADGNLELSGGGDGVGTFPFGSGKKYFELTIKSASAFSQGYYGIVDISQLGPRAWATSEIAAFRDTGSLYGDGSTGAAPAASQVGDIIGFAVDVDNQKLFISINGTYLNSADPAAGTGFSFSGRDFSNYAPLASLSAANSQVIVLNAGQRPFAYAAPSEFKALNTANLDDPTILDGSTQVDVVTYIGNGTTQTISGLEFSPDLVWIKNRDGVYSHLLFDQIRGTTKYLRSDHPGGEGTDVNSLTAFTEDGFTVGSTNAVNQSAGAIVAWAWDTGSSTVENTDGSITSNVRANPSAGFSIVSYTGTGSNATVGHGLNAAPKFVVVKNKDTTTNWPVWHSAYSATDYTELNTTIAATTASSIWNNTEPTSTTFSVGTDTLVNQSTKAMIAYCWAPVEGYSAFGSLDPSNQPFIYTGFRPKYLLYKLTSTTGPWVVYDTERNPYNVADLYLQADSDAAEATLAAWDFLSNGFKIRTSFPSGTILYAAFAENPFKTARAR